MATKPAQKPQRIDVNLDWNDLLDSVSPAARAELRAYLIAHLDPDQLRALVLQSMGAS